MFVGILQADLAIQGAQSLKDKRQVLKSLKDRARNKFNISIAEVDDLDIWRRSRIGIAAVGNDKRFVDGVLSSVVDFLRTNPEAELVDFQLEIL